MKGYVLARLKEPSTYRGIVLCLTAFGVFISPEQIEAITFIGLMLAGLLGATTPDKGAEFYDA